MHRRLPTLAAALTIAFCANGLARPAAAENGDFTITVAGLTAGTFQIRSTRTATEYAVSSRVASAGLAGLMRSFAVTSKVTGTQSGGQLRPKRYVAQSEGARSGRAAELVFDNGTPQVISAAQEPDPDAPKVDPASLTGVVDPLTALFGVLRDTPAAQACQLDQTMFDGHRVSRVTLSGARVTEDGVLCDGVYTRVAGYPPKDLAERKTFEFTARYTPQGDMLQIQQLSMNSLFGPARMTRN